MLNTVDVGEVLFQNTAVVLLTVFVKSKNNAPIFPTLLW